MCVYLYMYVDIYIHVYIHTYMYMIFLTVSPRDSDCNGTEKSRQ